jgi:hypothetical protein
VVSTLGVKAPNVHKWVLNYCHAFHLESQHWLDTDERSKDFVERLKLACHADAVPFGDIAQTLARILPAVNSGLTDTKTKLFSGHSLTDAQEAIRGKRLASSNHWRNYFDLVIGRYGVTDDWVGRFVKTAAERKAEAVAEFVALGSKTIASGGNEAERLLDRLRADAKGQELSNDQRIALFSVLADSIDDLSETVGPPDFWQGSVFTKAAWLGKELLAGVNSDQRLDTILEAIQQGRALSWLMYLVRDEMFDHGRIGDRKRESDVLLNSDQLDSLCDAAIARLKHESESGGLLVVHDPIYPMLTWRDIVGNEDKSLQKFIRKVRKTDDTLVTFVEKFAQIVRSTGGDYWRIDRKLLSDFFGYDELEKKLSAISGRETSLSERASEILQRIKNDRR